MSATLKAASDHCWQQEQWAHAEFLHLMTEHQRQDLAQPGPYPWRGIMSPSLIALISCLEDEGLYSASKLCEPPALAKKLKIYDHSPYDYEIARRIEARKAEAPA